MVLRDAGASVARRARQDLLDLWDHLDWMVNIVFFFLLNSGMKLDIHTEDKWLKRADKK